MSFQIRNFKRRTIDQLVEQQEKHVRQSHRPHSSNDDKNISQVNSSKDVSTLSSRPPPSISSQHFTRLPTKSKLDRQQVRIAAALFRRVAAWTRWSFSSSHFGTGYRHVLACLSLSWSSQRRNTDFVYRHCLIRWMKSTILF